MKLRHVFLFLLLALVVVAAVAVVTIANSVRQSAPQVVMLSDGTRLELLGVTRSGQSFSTEKWWEKQLRRFLPGQWLKWLPPASSFGGGIGNTNAITIWFLLTDALGSNVTSASWSQYHAVSSDGFAFPAGGGGGSCWADGRTYHEIYLEAFPRRQEEFELILTTYNNGKQSPMGTLRVKNPSRGPFTEWKPEVLPATHTNDPIAVTLESVTERANQYGDWLKTKYKLAATDPRWSKARSKYEEWFDATGNRGGFLSLDEPALKLGLTFHREGWTNFSDDEKFLIPDLRVPADGEMQLLQTNVTRGGVKITVQALAGAGTLCITNGTNFGSSPTKSSGWSTSSGLQGTLEMVGDTKPFFLIETTRPDPMDEILFHVFGPDGKPLSSSSSGWYGRRNNGRGYIERFDATNEVATISLEVIVSRGRKVEFLVNPAEVRRIGSTNK